ncbi:MAG: restriction endonuclease subunit S [Candidatus Manganitrophaceae bacterium]
MKYHAYSKYKPSGLEWLGDIPTHWDVRRLKTAANYWVSNVDKVASTEEELPVRLCNYTDVYYNDQIRPDMGLMETTATEEEIRRFGLLENDVVITKDSEEWNDIAVPALVVESAPDFVCGYHLAIVRPNQQKLLGRFLLRSFQACAINQQFQVAATGVTRYGLPKSSIGEAYIVLPPLLEQEAIADFLDAQTAKLDTLLAKKRELIEKLKEKRAAFISRTVTQGLPSEAARAAGLNPRPKLKPSGIEWLDNIPEHWEVKRLKYAATINDEALPETTEPSFEFMYVDISSVDPIDGIVAQEQLEFENAPSRARRIVSEGDTIVSTVRTYLRAISPIRSLHGNVIVSTGFAVVRPRSIEANFLSYALRETRFVETVVARSVGVSYPAVNVSDLSAIPIPIPPTAEQRAISDYLDHETTKIDRMIEKVETAIEKLQEYRAALITAAVTGKIDVRKAASASSALTQVGATARVQT